MMSADPHVNHLFNLVYIIRGWKTGGDGVASGASDVRRWSGVYRQ